MFPVAIILAGSLAWASPADRMKVKGKTPPPQSPPAAASQPAPILPEQMPPVPPQVGFEQGQLTINAQNSTLGDILRAVHRQTGANVDVPGNANERVVGKFGPGPARDVMATLLNGSHFNYVLLGSATDPAALDRVILTSKSGGGQVEQPSVVAQVPPGQPQPVIGNGPEQDMQSEDAPDVDNGDNSTDDQGQSAEEQQQQQQPPQPTPFGQPGVRTPEQLLQELQQRQQQGFPTPPTRGGIPSPGGQTTPQQQ